MPRDFYPRRESDIRAFTATFRSVIASDLAGYGLNPQQLADYTAVQESFAALYRAAHSPTERTPSVIASKDAARIALEAKTRQLTGIIRARPGVTGTMRSRLGLPLRNPGGGGRPLHVPSDAPGLYVRSMEGRTITLRLCESVSGRARRPRSAAGAQLFAFAGEEPPADPSAWRFMRPTSRTDVKLRLPVSDWLPPGAKLWLTACWFGGHLEQSRFAAPVCTYVPHGVAAFATGSMGRSRSNMLIAA